VVCGKLKEFAVDAVPVVDTRVTATQISALEEQYAIPKYLPEFDPMEWKETPLGFINPAGYEVTKSKLRTGFLESYHVVALSPNCNLVLLLRPKRLKIFNRIFKLDEPLMDILPRDEYIFRKAALGDNIFAATTSHSGCELWNLKHPSKDPQSVIQYPSEECWFLDCIALHEMEGLVIVAVGIWRREGSTRVGRCDLYVLSQANLTSVQQMRMTTEFFDSPKLLSFSANGSFLVCTTSERNRVFVWHLDGPSGLEPVCQTARSFTAGSDGITSALIWTSPSGYPYLTCTTSPGAERAKNGGEWSFLSPASDPFPGTDSHCFHCFHHVQHSKHYALHACAIPPQCNVVALLSSTGKLCMVSLRADDRGGITSDHNKRVTDVERWDLGENNWDMVAIRFDPEGKRLIGVNSRGTILIAQPGTASSNPELTIMGPDRRPENIRRISSLTPSSLGGSRRPGSWSSRSTDKGSVSSGALSSSPR